MNLPPLPPGFQFVDEAPLRNVDRSVTRGRPENPRGVSVPPLPPGYTFVDKRPSRGAAPGGMDTALYGMKRLMEDPDLRLSPEAAAGFMGSMWHESGGFKHMQEIKPRAGRGGYGWAQWTGPRRRQYEAFVKARGMDPDSNEANFAFLRHDLLNTPEGRVVGAVRGVKSPEQAAVKFTNMYERPGVPALGARQRFAKNIYAAWQASNKGLKTPASTVTAASDLPPLPPGYQFAD